MIAVAIVAHTTRRTQAENLAATTEADYVSVDDGTLGCEGNHKHVLKWHHNNPNTQWAVILEDDAEPVNTFRDQLHAALTAAPTPIVSLYLGTNYPKHWQARIATKLRTTNTHWFTAPKLLHAVGYAIRSSHLPALADIDNNMPIDQALSNWANRNNITIAYTRPSLINHADTTPAITKRYDEQPRNKPRRAWQTGTRDHWANTTTDL